MCCRGFLQICFVAQLQRCCSPAVHGLKDMCLAHPGGSGGSGRAARKVLCRGRAPLREAQGGFCRLRERAAGFCRQVATSSHRVNVDRHCERRRTNHPLSSQQQRRLQHRSGAGVGRGSLNILGLPHWQPKFCPKYTSVPSDISIFGARPCVFDDDATCVR